MIKIGYLSYGDFIGDYDEKNWNVTGKVGNPTECGWYWITQRNGNVDCVYYDGSKYIKTKAKPLAWLKANKPRPYNYKKEYIDQIEKCKRRISMLEAEIESYSRKIGDSHDENEE